MTKRPLGRTGVSIAPLVFGGNVFGWTADRKRSFELLDRFVAAGFDAVDSADMYSAWVPGNSGGESETVLGEWMHARGTRDRMTVITKVGLEMPGRGQGLSADWIERAAEDSLRRLRTDCIDIYFSHVFDDQVPIEETLAAHERLLKTGKVRAIGASNHSAAQLAAALKVAADKGLPRYEVLQPEYNLHDRGGYEDGLRDLALAEGLGVITYYSLASGFLTGKYRSAEDLGKSSRGGGVKAYLTARGLRILSVLDEVAAAHDAEPAQVALAWLMGRKGVTAPIASATSVEQLDTLIGAVRLSLSADDMARLDAAGESGPA